MRPKSKHARTPGPGSRETAHYPIIPSRPFLFINMAMSADGKIATGNRMVSGFGSARDREHLLELRSKADAVMSGARTVDSNPVNLGPGPAKYRRQRLKRGLAEYNVRVIVSGAGSIDPGAEIFRHRFSPIILLTTERAPTRKLRRLERLVDAVNVCGSTHIDFMRGLEWLKKEWNVRRLLCEGGGELNDALFRAGLADEIHLTICPCVIGGRTAPTIADGFGAGNLGEANRLELVSLRRKFSELFLVYRVKTDKDRQATTAIAKTHFCKGGVGTLR